MLNFSQTPRREAKKKRKSSMSSRTLLGKGSSSREEAHGTRGPISHSNSHRGTTVYPIMNFCSSASAWGRLTTLFMEWMRILVHSPIASITS